ncbi:Type II secretion system protein E [Pseudobythopirellula maris]|uniref:Type II secretion system protein E n=1 Tax=Pseudobythopirellula maris TaxID=2527991 RepID=A0A5C5ZN36_9BACT|nr:GspE/PulE family protein [Pseudobythopirellula maris]TWT88914.1 Type II secretion system protein E [Pseudobythopirellula maris]
MTTTLEDQPKAAEADARTGGGKIDPSVFTGPLGQRLISANLLDDEGLEKALIHQQASGQRLGETLLELGILSEEELLPFIEDQLGARAVRLREGLLDPQAVHRIPFELAEALDSLVLFHVRDELTVAMDDPNDLDAIDRIEAITGLRVRPVFAFGASLGRWRRRAYEADFRVDAVTADLDDDALELRSDATDIDITNVHTLADGSPVINLVNYLMLQAVRKGASDIHIEPGRKSAVVRFRIDGQLVEVLTPRRDIYPAVVSRVKVMAKMDIAEHRVPQDGRCQVVADGKEIDLRVSSMPTVLGEKVVIRVLDKKRLTFNLNELGMNEAVLGTVRGMLTKPHGLMLVTGPTGSGKTTTLYSALELIKSARSNIVTVEDPVEYQIEQVNQVQVDATRGVGFVAALRSILRQDPDVIMLGEIRDGETAEVAIRAALTGHLVLSTLHTNDSASAPMRMADMGVEPYKIAAALVGVVAQRLVRTICPQCKTPEYPSTEYLHSLGYKGEKRRAFSRGEGCRECFDTGFRGRRAIYEVLDVTQPARTAIADGASPTDLRERFVAPGSGTLLDAGFELAEQEHTSLAEVSRVALFD